MENKIQQTKTKNKPIILEVKNLVKYFISKFGINKAVDNVSFTLREGEVMGLVGQSGSGKTTIGKSIIRLFKEVNGLVIFGDKIISGTKLDKQTDKYLKNNMQMVFQNPHTALNERRNIFSTINEPIKVQKILKKDFKEIYKDWDKVINFFGLFLEKFYAEKYLEYIKLKNKNFKQHFSKAYKIFQEMKMDNYSNIEDLVNEYISNRYTNRFAFYRSRLAWQTQVQKDLYTKYFVLQKKTTQLQINKYEKDLVMAKQKLQIYTKEIAYNANIFKLIIQKRKEQNQNIKQKQNQTKDNLKSLIHGQNIKIKFFKEIARNTNSFDSYKTNKFKSFKSKAIKEILIGHFKNNDVKVLTIHQIIKIFEEIQNTINKHTMGMLGKFNKISQLKQAVLNINITSKDVQKYSDDNIHNIKIEYKKQIKVLQDKLSSNIPQKIDLNVLNKIKDNINLKQDLYNHGRKQFLDQWQRDMAKIRQKTHQAKEFLMSNDSKQLLINNYKIANNVHKIIVSKIKQSKNKKLFKEFKRLNKQSKIQYKAFVFEEKQHNKNMKMMKWLYGMKSRNKKIAQFFTYNLFMTRKVYKALEDVGLKSEHAYRYPHEFSGGQKQRIVIARALISNPKIIIADEPISSLDISIQAQLVNLLIDLTRTNNISMIFIGHDLSMVEYIADSILVMHLGKIVERGKADKVFTNPLHPYTQTLFDAIPLISNANESFQQFGNINKYLKNYNTNNLPFEKEVAKNHFLLGDRQQLTKWSKFLDKPTRSYEYSLKRKEINVQINNK